VTATKERFVVSEDRPTYSQVPTPIIQAVREGKLPIVAIGYYAVLDSYRNRKNGRCDPGLVELRDATDLSIPTIRKINAALVGAGFMRIEPGKGPRDSQKYILMYSPQWTTRGHVDSTANNLHAESGVTGSSRETSRETSREKASSTELSEPSEPGKQDGRRETRPDSGGSTGKGEKPKPPIHRVIQDWTDTYQSVVGTKPMITGKVVGLMRKMLAHYGDEVVLAMIGNFFHPTGKAVPFTIDNFYNLADKLYQEVKGKVYGDSR